METFKIEIEKENLELNLEFTKHNWSVKCFDNNSKFYGYICGGSYSYDNKRLCIERQKIESNPFTEEIESKVIEILIKNKILNK